MYTSKSNQPDYKSRELENELEKLMQQSLIGKGLKMMVIYIS